MEPLIIFILIITFSITILSLIITFLLLHKHLKDKDKKYATHSLTILLYILSFFIFIDGFYHSLLYLSQFGFISQKIFFVLTSYHIQLLPKLGIFIASVFIVHFLMEKRIEDFKIKEDSLAKLKKYNFELETKLKETEKIQDTLFKKTQELEKYNEIAKQREEKMYELMKKIETLEKKIKK